MFDFHLFKALSRSHSWISISMWFQRTEFVLVFNKLCSEMCWFSKALTVVSPQRVNGHVHCKDVRRLSPSRRFVMHIWR